MHDNPSLSLEDYMAELNERLRQHPDCLGVFSSVIEEVARDYDLAMPARIDFGRPHQQQSRQPSFAA